MKKIAVLLLLSSLSLLVKAQSNVIDEIIWVIGDEAILRSEVESQRLFLLNEGHRFEGDPYCLIPEQIAVNKLFLNQARIDSIEVSEAQILQSVDAWMNYAIKEIGGEDKMEEYFRKKLSQIREERKVMAREQYTVEQMKQKLIGDIKLTPSEVRKYFNQLPQDSLPTIPTTVEVQIITMEPKIPIEETDAIKARLREFTEQVNNGERDFSVLARTYSEDPASSTRGGELGFRGKGEFLPEFANVAFNLKDNKRVSNVVETEYGFHIIQLIEKRGDRLNARHILLRPRVSEKEMNVSLVRMDSLYQDITNGKFTFEEATFVSADKDTRNNKGLMVNRSETANYGTPKFEFQELPQEMGAVVYNMQVGEISKPFKMLTEMQKEVVAIVKLKSRKEAHKANITDDYQALKSIVENKRRQEIIKKWIVKQQADTYVKISEGWSNCDFQYPGWIKE